MRNYNDKPAIFKHDRKHATIVKEYKKYIYCTFFDKYSNGYKTRYHFPNGYGASVIYTNFSYGLELAVLYNGEINYKTVITDDVVPYIRDKQELAGLLERIKELD